MIGKILHNSYQSPLNSSTACNEVHPARSLSIKAINFSDASWHFYHKPNIQIIQITYNPTWLTWINDKFQL